MTYDVIIKDVEIIDKNDGKTYNIGITGHNIAYIGTDAIEGKEVIEGKDHLAVPGFVNAHTHVAMNLLRSYADDLPLMEWLTKKIWPAEEHLDAETVYWGTQHAILEMLKNGVTCFSDMYFFMEQSAQAAADTGMRCTLSRGIIGPKLSDTINRLKENTELFHKWHGYDDNRIKVMLGPHAPYTCPPASIEAIVKEAQNLHCSMHIHLAETAGEVSDCQKQYGYTPIALMDSLGLFELPTVAAHCVHVTPEDIAILAKKNVSVAHCPQSNLKLASGIAPIADMLKAKINVALGTDGAASNNNLDMLEEARLAAILAKGSTGDSTVVPAKTALQMATVNGAKALGYDDLGTISLNQKADIVLYDMHKPWWYPRNNRISLLIYAANSTDVDTVLVNGKILMKRGEMLTIDTEKVYAEATRQAQKLTATH